jgi:4-hydroxymandelate oxidase
MAHSAAPANGPRLSQPQRSTDAPAAPDDPGREPPFLDLDALAEQSRELLPADVADYYAGGAGTERPP